MQLCLNTQMDCLVFLARRLLRVGWQKNPRLNAKNTWHGRELLNKPVSGPWAVSSTAVSKLKNEPQFQLQSDFELNNFEYEDAVKLSFHHKWYISCQKSVFCACLLGWLQHTCMAKKSAFSRSNHVCAGSNPILKQWKLPSARPPAT